MNENPKIEITEQQTLEIGRIVVDNRGAHFQTRVGPSGTFYLHWQFGPNRPTHYAEIHKDGEVVFR